MKKIIENLRNKPDHIKSRYVIVLSVIATVVVVAVWVTTNALLKTSDDTIKTDGPLKMFTNIFKSGVNATAKDYKANKEALNKTLKSESQTKEEESLPPEQPVDNFLDTKTTPTQQ